MTDKPKKPKGLLKHIDTTLKTFDEKLLKTAGHSNGSKSKSPKGKGVKSIQKDYNKIDKDAKKAPPLHKKAPSLKTSSGKTKTTSKSQRKRSDAPKKYKHEVRSAHDTNFRRTGVEVGAMHSASSGYVLKSGPVSCSTPPTSAGRNHVPVNAANPCAYAGKASSRPNFCGSCGAAVLGAGKFCGECGTAIC